MTDSKDMHASDQKQKNPMVLRVRRSTTGSGRYELGESRGTHFKKTLLLAGALGLLAFCVYFFTQVNAHSSDSAAAAASPHANGEPQ